VSDEQESNVVSIGETPFRLTAEMILRHYMANMDRVEDIIVCATFKDSATPMISVSSDTHPMFMAFSGNVINRLSTKHMDQKETPRRGGASPKDHA
jgi:hypothetical protein